MTDEPRDREPPAGKNKNKGKPARASSGRGLAALMLILGLLIGLLLGGLVGLFTPRTGVLEGLPGSVEPSPVPTPVPTTITRTVEVEAPVTPQDCLVALEDLVDYMDELSDARQALMRADLARVAGDAEAAGAGFADVDRQLRSLILAANAQSLRAAVDGCREAGDVAALTQEDDQQTQAADEGAGTASPSPAGSPEGTPSPGPTAQAGPGSEQGSE